MAPHCCRLMTHPRMLSFLRYARPSSMQAPPESADDQETQQDTRRQTRRQSCHGGSPSVMAMGRPQDVDAHRSRRGDTQGVLSWRTASARAQSSRWSSKKPVTTSNHSVGLSR